MMRGRDITKRRRAGNLRPAPLFITPSVVARVLELTERPASRVIEVPILPVKLVDRPRRSEDPRLARANDDSAPPPGETIRSGEDGQRGAVSECQLVPEAAPQPVGVIATPGVATADTSCGSEAQAPEGPKGSGDGVSRPPLNACEATVPVAEPQPPRVRTRKFNETPKVETRRDADYHACRQREARELEQPVDSRIDAIRLAGERLAERSRSVDMGVDMTRARLPIGSPTPHSDALKKAVGSAWFVQRREMIDAAIAFLNSRAFFVQVVDRTAQVRKYRVAGKRDSMLAEDVIEIALAKGLVVDPGK